jgi:hypothetical protein
MDLDHATKKRLGYSTSKGMERGRREAEQVKAQLHKAVYHDNKIVPQDKVGLVAQVAEAYQKGFISDRQAREVLDKYGL